jgi:hypothetical protein
MEQKYAQQTPQTLVIRMTINGGSSSYVVGERRRMTMRHAVEGPDSGADYLINLLHLYPRQTLASL